MKKFFSPLYLCATYLFLYLPILILFVYSFNNTEFSTQWHGFTWQWYRELFKDDTLLQVTWNSILLALSSASSAVLLGFIMSTALYRYQFHGKRFWQGLVFILLLFPDLVIGVALLLLFYLVSIPFGFISLWLAHTTFCLPFVIVTLYSRLIGFEKNLIEAAYDLGANEIIVVKRLLFPLLAGAMFSAWLLSFTLSLDDVMISFFVSGPDFQILPLQLFSLVRLGVKPEINALCSLLFLFTLLIVTTAQFLLRRKETCQADHLF